MRLDDILQQLTIPHKETKFQRPPSGTYLVWYDNVIVSGDDRMEKPVDEHAVSFELYAAAPDAAAEEEVDAALKSCGVPYEKTGRQWLQTEQVYMTIYDFGYFEKE